MLRRALHLILLLIIFGFIIGALRSSLPHLPAKAALVIQPVGQIVEQRSGDPLEIAFNEARGQRQTETLLWDITETLRAAAKDSRIPAIVLQLDDFTGAGQPTLEEVAAAMREFRAAGKKIIAYGSSFSQSQYYLAAQADEVYLDPLGEVLLEGYERYRMYYKGLLDKLAVDVHLFRVGEFKSAAEDLVRTGMSDEDRLEARVYLEALWTSYKATVGKARDLSPEVIDQYANGYIDALRTNSGDAARVALEAGLVTGIKTADEVTTRVQELVGEDESGGGYPAIDLGDYTRIHAAEQQLRRGAKGRVGVVVASGEILDGRQPSGVIGGITTADLLREARDDDDIAAVVLRIDSPGGSIFASEQIYREVAAIKAAGKPVVVSMGDLAASGGYYVAAPADEIFASATTITGSIGIYSVLPTLDRTLGKFGVTVDGVGTTALSGKLRLDRPLDPLLKDYLQLNIERGYELFVGHVAAGRNKTRDQVDALGRGRVWIGSEAKAQGLVDTLGGFDDAVKAAARRANLKPGYAVERVEPELSWAEQLAMQLKVRAARLSGNVLGPAVGEVQAALEPLAPLSRELARVKRLAASQKTLAYCFCSVE
ncbi:MAG: signal peptide peptidase SppA [Proteobacteria bacterium]|nr:signal peptide peptidase SppA [Pseudomonadota bacterium]MBK7116531.1 signal peptide peptidase SppA [Pseudomonadota bacterium]MBK9252961.1 signal peptide peptidase SppA [Pseudomonadota bacterium]MCC6631244.1 signal peptide peptidase SppA [Gammaproteobacteria bacterium]